LELLYCSSSPHSSSLSRSHTFHPESV
jgi:hypothetical protein